MTARDFHQSIFKWAIDCKMKLSKRPLVIGINGPQGSGKSTLGRSLVSAAEEIGCKAVSLSIDDFYLTRCEQIRLSEAHPENIFLKARGYPGTHDVVLGAKIVSQLSSQDESLVKVPRYDKSAHNGLGDRHPQENWSTVATPLDFVFIEGWMLGFSPIKSIGEGLSQSHGQSMQKINELLGPYAKWHESISAYVVLWTKDLKNIVRWRIEAEAKMRKEVGQGMSDDDCRKYIEKFLPAYELYVPQLLNDMNKSDSPHLVIEIGADRLPLN